PRARVVDPVPAPAPGLDSTHPDPSGSGAGTWEADGADGAGQR
ncbi:MAG: hypothetical protein AVDCRST_MAG41-571, partial [uncultured Corynebacteriales bacterium]